MQCREMRIENAVFERKMLEIEGFYANIARNRLFLCEIDKIKCHFMGYIRQKYAQNSPFWAILSLNRAK